MAVHLNGVLDGWGLIPLPGCFLFVTVPYVIGSGMYVKLLLSCRGIKTLVKGYLIVKVNVSFDKSLGIRF